MRGWDVWGWGVCGAGRQGSVGQGGWDLWGWGVCGAETQGSVGQGVWHLWGGMCGAGDLRSVGLGDLWG